MKIQICRHSGMPVQPADMQAYREEFGSAFDKAKEAAGEDMLVLQASLAEVDKQLNAKYSLTGKVELPKSKKAWQALMAAYEAPIMMARQAEGDNDLVLVIMDQPLGT